MARHRLRFLSERRLPLSRLGEQILHLPPRGSVRCRYSLQRLQRALDHAPHGDHGLIHCRGSI